MSSTTNHLPAKTRIRLPDLPPAVFQHPLDAAATATLRRVRGFDRLVSLFLEYGFERLQYVHNMSGSIRVTERQLPQLLGMLRESCEVMGVPEPELYVQQGEVNAYTAGHNHPYIVLLSGLLDTMNDEEIMGVIAHEVGHIKCGHVLYKQMSRGIVPFLDLVGKATLGVGALVGMGVESALLVWDRRSELSADRAALLVMQDVNVCNSMLMKIAGGGHRFAEELVLEEFLNQAKKYREDTEDESKLDKFYRFIAGSKANHPFAIERCHALLEWEESGEYENVLAGTYIQTASPSPPQLSPSASCRNCASALFPGSKFCSACGKSQAL